MFKRSEVIEASINAAKMRDQEELAAEKGRAKFQEAVNYFEQVSKWETACQECAESKVAAGQAFAEKRNAAGQDYESKKNLLAKIDSNVAKAVSTNPSGPVSASIAAKAAKAVAHEKSLTQGASVVSKKEGHHV